MTIREFKEHVKTRKLLDTEEIHQFMDIMSNEARRCLFVYDQTEWTKFEEKLRALPITNANVRNFTRFMLGGASACEVDKQGRILLPAPLRTFAHLEKEVVLVGVGSRIEIWNRAAWDEKNDLNDNDMEAIAESMEGLGI